MQDMIESTISTNDDDEEMNDKDTMKKYTIWHSMVTVHSPLMRHVLQAGKSHFSQSTNKIYCLNH